MKKSQQCHLWGKSTDVRAMFGSNKKTVNGAVKNILRPQGVKNSNCTDDDNHHINDGDDDGDDDNDDNDDIDDNDDNNYNGDNDGDDNDEDDDGFGRSFFSASKKCYSCDKIFNSCEAA